MKLRINRRIALLALPLAASALLLVFLGGNDVQVMIAAQNDKSVRDEMANEPDATTSDDEPTCSLATPSDCSDGTSDYKREEVQFNRDDLTRQVVPLSDETFDELTWTASPATWLVMFKTDSCAICQKAFPVFEQLSVDTEVLQHNDAQLTSPKESSAETDKQSETPKGPVYIATIDAGWSGRDVTKRFEVDATPTILVIRNEGYDKNKYNKVVDSEGNHALYSKSGMKMHDMDPRSYYIYHGQRAQYPLKRFIMGEFVSRKQFPVPPPIPETERKSLTFAGRLYDYVMPNAKWAGGIVVKVMVGWYIFLGIIGLFMRVHNYAWGDDGEDDEKRDEVIENEKAKGAAEYKPENSDERSARRQKEMWERKMQNRAKFAANKEARLRKEKGGDDDDDDDEFEGIGVSVKKADARKTRSQSKKEAANKSKKN